MLVSVYIFFFCQGGMLIGESWVLKSPTSIVSQSGFTSDIIRYEIRCSCLRHTFRIMMSFYSLVSMKWLSVYFLTNFGWKSVLSAAEKVTPACFLDPFTWNFFHSFTLRWHLTFVWHLFLGDLQVDDSCFLIQSTSLCPFLQRFILIFFDCVGPHLCVVCSFNCVGPHLCVGFVRVIAGAWEVQWCGSLCILVGELRFLILNYCWKVGINSCHLLSL